MNARFNPPRLLILIACTLTLGQLSVSADELPLRETPQGTLFGNDRLAVRLDPQTGWPGEVFCDGRCVVNAPESRQLFDIKQDDSWVTGGGTAIQSVDVQRLSADSIRCRMKAGDWRLDACVQLFPDQRMLRRWFEVTWQGSANTKIKGLWFQAGQLPLNETGNYFCPAQYPPKLTTAKELAAGHGTTNGRSPSPVIADSGNGWSALWILDESPDYSDRGSSGVFEGKDFVRVTQSFNMLGHMRQGEPQRVGDTWLWLQPNDSETALRRMGEWFRIVGQVPPVDRPDWLKRVILYSFHPGGTIGSQCRDLGGFQPATALLPHIRNLGCNAIWLMPLEDKSIYWPRDYYKFQEGLGTADDYKALTATAHALGMRVWQDCVPHGGSNEYPRAKEHPEWLAQNEDGSTLHYWCFDFNWPSWIDYMTGVVGFYTREYGLDGFRIDACGGSKIPNWNPEIPYARASHAQAQGGLAMQRALRQTVKSIRPDGANLAEVGASIHGTVSDSTYDFSLCYQVLHDFRKVPADVFVPRLRRWLHEQQCAEVPDLVRMRHLESHDSLRSALWYGARPQRALLALISWIHGIPMVYHEMEDGNYQIYRQIFHVRSHVPELNSGTSDYLSITAPDGVFACLRTGVVPEEGTSAWHADYAWDTTPGTAERASIVLVNLNGRTMRGPVSLPTHCLPEAIRSATNVRDLLTDENLPLDTIGETRLVTVTLPPFAYTVLRPASNPLPPLPPVATAKPQDVPPPSASTPAIPLEVTAQGSRLLIDPRSGLASAWEENGVNSAITMDLALPEETSQVGADADCRQLPDGIEVTRQFGSHTLKLPYSTSTDDGVNVVATWQGDPPQRAAIAFDLPKAVTWHAQTAEGRFASPFRVRHPVCDGVTGSIYRLPQGTSVLWDSRHHPFGLSPDQAWVGAVSANGKETAIQFDPSCLPARVQILDRIGDSHGMKVLIAWQDDQDGITAGGKELRFRLGGTFPDDSSAGITGDKRLRVIGGGWEFENAHYRARIARTGALTGLWRREADSWHQVLHHANTYTDKGFGDLRYAQENDVEATVRIEKVDTDLRLTAVGEMRGFGRFDKMSHPVRFFTSYTFGNSPVFHYSGAVKATEAPTADYAFLSLLLRTQGIEKVTYTDAEGTFLSAERSNSGERFAQLAQSATPQRLPTDICLFDAGEVTMRLGHMKWLGVSPDNVFVHGNDLHLAWMDGHPKNLSVGKWQGMTCSVACGDTAVPGAEPLPLGSGEKVTLVQNGNFENSDSPQIVLLKSGQKLPRTGGVDHAWTLPPGAEYVVEDGSRCMKVVGDGQSYRLIRQRLPQEEFKPGSKWRLTARMKGAGVERGDVDWKTACLRWSVSRGERTTYTTASLPWGDSPWKTYEVELTAPEGLKNLAIEAGMNGNKGNVWIDDVRLERLDAPSQ